MAKRSKGEKVIVKKNLFSASQLCHIRQKTDLKHQLWMFSLCGAPKAVAPVVIIPTYSLLCWLVGCLWYLKL